MSDQDVRTIKVFKEGPVWDRYDRWFKVPQADLDALFVCAYAMPADASTHEMQCADALIRADHPDCVLVY